MRSAPTTIARWVKQLGGSGKTISNKHGFLSRAFNAAVRAGVMTSNPCQGRRLPHTRVEETVFLTPPEFVLLRDHIERERLRNLATWFGDDRHAILRGDGTHHGGYRCRRQDVLNQQSVEVLRKLPPGDRTTQNQEIDPHHQPAARGAGRRRPDYAGLPVYQRCRQPRSRTRVLQRRVEARPR
jgi:hypothetical protein